MTRAARVTRRCAERLLVGPLVLIVWVLSLAGLVPPTAAAESARKPISEISISEWEAIWTDVLTLHVDEAGRIDFAGLQSDRSGLDQVVGFIAAVDPISAPARFPTTASRIAYYINAYNALAMFGVLDAGIPESLGGLRKIFFFYFRTFTVGGRSISLYDLENEIIRSLGEERVHFALNCMVVSCPRLPRTAFRAGTLDEQLARAARSFIAENRNVRIDPSKREIWLSGIFDFYTKDFLAKAPSLLAYVNRYCDEAVPVDLRVRFLDYDWTVNDQTRLSGRGAADLGRESGCSGRAGAPH